MSFPFDLHSATVSDSHLSCHAPTMPFFSRSQHSTAVERRPCCAVALRRTAWSEHGMASVYQTRPHSVNQTGKTHSKPLATRHGSGTVWARHGHGMLCVNRPLNFPVALLTKCLEFCHIYETFSGYRFVAFFCVLRNSHERTAAFKSSAFI